jgi:hypothetical protein
MEDGSGEFSNYTKNSWYEIPILNPDASGPNSNPEASETIQKIRIIILATQI